MSAAALLAAIRAAPDDDAPRLVYADSLDEYGQPERAEFIRVQIELAQHESPALRRREAELLAEHHDEFAEVSAGLQLRFRFDRGFVVGFARTTILTTKDPERSGSFLYVFRADGTWGGISDGRMRTTADDIIDMIRIGGPMGFYTSADTRYWIQGFVLPADIVMATGRSRTLRGTFDGSRFAIEYATRKRTRPRLIFAPIDFPNFDAFLETQS
jgi:uncharacterized protein (TIGR02996 family)